MALTWCNKFILSSKRTTKTPFYSLRGCTSWSAPLTSRKHLHTKVTPDFHLTYSKNGGKSGVEIKMIKSKKFQNFSIKSYVVDVY